MPRESNLGNARCLSGSGQAFAVSGLDKRVQHRCLLRAETLVIIVSPRPKTCLCVSALILRMRWIRRCWFAMLVLRRRVQSYAPSVGCESGKINVFVVKCARRGENVLKDDFALTLRGQSVFVYRTESVLLFLSCRRRQRGVACLLLLSRLRKTCCSLLQLRCFERGGGLRYLLETSMERQMLQLQETSGTG